MAEAGIRVVWENWQPGRDDAIRPDERLLDEIGVALIRDGQDGDARLIVCDTPDDEVRALRDARPTDEVLARAGLTPRLLALRLKQMVGRLTLQRSATIDPLTGLLDRRHFQERLSRQIDGLSPDEAWGLMFIDLDHFKTVNDRHGHQAGDEVLIAGAGRLQSALLGSDVIARIGGEEFAVLARREDDAALQALAQSLRRTFAQAPFIISGGAVAVTSSIGQTRLQRGSTMEMSFGEADRALYAAKAAGRDRVVTFRELAAQAEAQEGDVDLLHFQNVSRVVNERSANLVSTFGRSLVNKARQLANTDRLTAVWNRGYFDRRLAREIELCRRDGRPLSLALMDLDHFGQFNKDHGLPTGDAVLKRFGELAMATIRPNDWFARYGGEEFALVLDATAAEAARVAERVRATLEATPVVAPSGQQLRVTVSIGIAEFDAAQMADPVALIQRASDALRLAKLQGRNTLRVA